MRETCSVSGCTNLAYKEKLCSKHYIPHRKNRKKKEHNPLRIKGIDY